MSTYLAWAAAAAMATLAIGYALIGPAAILRGSDPPQGYWRRRLTLNLVENNLGMVLAAGLGVAVAVLLGRNDPAAWPLMAAAAVVDALYAALVVTLTPRDWWHAIPMAAAVGCYAVAWSVSAGVL